MKQALLITAYKNPPHLINLIDAFDDNYSMYIHIDNKGEFTPADIKELQARPNVKFVSQKYKVQWASINHLKAILLLCEEAAKDPDVEYMHTITGHDYPMKSAADISTFMSANKGTLFMDANKLPYEGWYGGGLDRFMYYYPCDLINIRTPRNYKIKERLIELQQKYKLERKYPKCFPSDLYGGLVYWSIPSDAIRYVLDFSRKNPSYLRRFKFTYCSEEAFFQTILMNSPYKEKVSKDNLRFMIWEKRNGNNPAVLDDTDITAIQNSNALFARKFEYPVSFGLYEKLREIVTDK